MVILQTEAPSATLEEEIDESSDSQGEMEESPEKVSHGYEKLRETRMKENQERMQKLGLFGLALKMKSVKPIRKNNFSAHKTSPSPALFTPTEPCRRSSRLQSAGAISYCELKVPKQKKVNNEIDLMRKEGSRPEMYTEEQEKLLGNTERVWDLFVDGYGSDGKRIYDSFKGKTCHQCRQKTLGHRTHCSSCEMVRGQFCGDCLYIRYGENVLEANENPDWICPVCRGICNCSLCRQGKGWAPTGSLYKKVSNLGFKSVAHYLIQTYRSQPENESPKTEDLAIIPFEPSTETTPQGQTEAEDNVIKIEQEMKDQSEKDGVVVDDNQIVEYVKKSDGVEFETRKEFPGEIDVVLMFSPPKKNAKKRTLDLEDSIGRRLKLRRRGSTAVLGC